MGVAISHHVIITNISYQAKVLGICRHCTISTL